MTTIAPTVGETLVCAGRGARARVGVFPPGRRTAGRFVINNERCTNDMCSIVYGTVNRISLADNYYIVFRTQCTNNGRSAAFLLLLFNFFFFRVVDNACTKADGTRVFHFP